MFKTFDGYIEPKETWESHAGSIFIAFIFAVALLVAVYILSTSTMHSPEYQSKVISPDPNINYSALPNAADNYK